MADDSPAVREVVRVLVGADMVVRVVLMFGLRCRLASQRPNLDCAVGFPEELVVVIDGGTSVGERKLEGAAISTKAVAARVYSPRPQDPPLAAEIWVVSGWKSGFQPMIIAGKVAEPVRSIERLSILCSFFSR